MKMISFEDIIGYDGIKEELKKLITVLNDVDRFKQNKVTIPMGVLLHGDPGLGKTMMAHAFVNNLKRKKVFIQKDLPDGEFVNYFKARIREAISNAPSVVFLDDLDKFSNNDARHKNSDEFVTLQTLIDEARGKDVFFIATANDLENIPDSMLRTGRFDIRIEFQKPNVNHSIELVKHFLKNKKTSDDFDLDEIANLLIDGSITDLETIINDAYINAICSGRDYIDYYDVLNSALKTLFSIIDEETECDENSLLATAVHEAGHALTSELLEPNSVNFVTIKGNELYGGLTCQRKSIKHRYDFNSLCNKIKVALGGKVATDIRFHQPDLGDSSDLSRAYHIVRDLYTDYGISDYGLLNNYSENARHTLDDYINKFLKEQEKQLRELLLLNIDKFNLLVDELLNKKTIRGKELRALLNS